FEPAAQVGSRRRLDRACDQAAACHSTMIAQIWAPRLCSRWAVALPFPLALPVPSSATRGGAVVVHVDVEKPFSVTGTSREWPSAIETVARSVTENSPSFTNP